MKKYRGQKEKKRKEKKGERLEESGPVCVEQQGINRGRGRESERRCERRRKRRREVSGETRRWAEETGEG